MTLDYCPHGFYRPWFNGRCPMCYSPPKLDGHPLGRPKLRDAAMWAAFVHELRAEWILSRHSDALRLPDDRHEPTFDPNCPKCGRHSDRVIDKLRAMSPEEARQTFVDAGIVDEDGNLTEPYRG